MANQHYGNLGDVWKHLPLAEVLGIVQPAQYWESHAGSAGYVLTHSAARDFGIFHFLEHADADPVLRISTYRALLAEAAGGGVVPATYPGSPVLAMRLLRRRMTQFAFCDLDGDSLLSIDDAARQMELSSGVVSCVAQDGVATMLRRVAELHDDQVDNTLLFVDPFHLTAANSQNQTSLDLFAAAAQRGILTMLWYCAHTRAEVQLVHDALHPVALALHETRAAPMLWSGEIDLLAMEEQGFQPPGVGMCGLLCAHLPDDAREMVRSQGRALAGLYTRATRPDGSSGALRFSEPCASPSPYDWFAIDSAAV